MELPLVRRLKTMTVIGKKSSIVEEIFDKTSEHIAQLVNKMWLSRYPRCCYIIYDNGSVNTYVKHMVFSISQLR